jgi:hypothetical protein
MSYGGDSATPDQCGRESADDITFLEAEDSYIGDTILLRTIPQHFNGGAAVTFCFGKIRISVPKFTNLLGQCTYITTQLIVTVEEEMRLAESMSMAVFLSLQQDQDQVRFTQILELIDHISSYASLFLRTFPPLTRCLMRLTIIYCTEPSTLANISSKK